VPGIGTRRKSSRPRRDVKISRRDRDDEVQVLITTTRLPIDVIFHGQLVEVILLSLRQTAIVVKSIEADSCVTSNVATAPNLSFQHNCRRTLLAS